MAVKLSLLLLLIAGCSKPKELRNNIGWYNSNMPAAKPYATLKDNHLHLEGDNCKGVYNGDDEFYIKCDGFNILLHHGMEIK